MPSGRRIPVLMAASGPKAIEVAGEVADGALLLVGFNSGIVETALGHLERGAKRAGRRLEDLEIIWAVRTATMKTTAEALRMARPTAVHWGVMRWGGYWLGPAGLRLPPLEIPEVANQVYPDLSHAHDWEAAIKATAFVPDEIVARLCEAIGLIGTPEDCAARIVEMTKLGVRNLYLMPLLTFAPPEAEVAAFRDTVFPRLADAGLRPTVRARRARAGGGRDRRRRGRPTAAPPAISSASARPVAGALSMPQGPWPVAT